MINKDRFSITVGVAFVWFTTQFGGGFASGAQLRSYFIDFGIWCLVTPILAQAVCAFYQWYALRFAYRNKAFDYRTFNDKLYGKFAPIFSNLYEIVYVVLLCVAPAVAFATGGATMSAMLGGVPYFICTAIIGFFIFIVGIYGTDMVRKVASTLSILIVAGLLIVFVPNIIAQWGDIVANIGTMAAAPAPVGPALWKSFVYMCFQLASIGLIVQHAQPFTSEKEAGKSMRIGFFVNSAMVMLATFGLLAVVNQPDYASSTIPVLVLVQNGVGGAVMGPIISILIILGSVSTAVNMVAAMTNRICSRFDQGYSPTGKPTKMAILVTLFFTVLAFAVAQFGLIPLVNKGYGILGYITIPVVMIPYVIHFFTSRNKVPDAIPTAE